jgi:hypothetical protein
MGSRSHWLVRIAVLVAAIGAVSLAFMAIALVSSSVSAHGDGKDDHPPPIMTVRIVIANMTVRGGRITTTTADGAGAPPTASTRCSSPRIWTH